MAKDLKEKIVLITGGATGIGRATALAFSDAGAKVVVSDINVTGGEETVKTIKDTGRDAQFIKCDVSRGSEVEAMINKTVSSYGRLDYAFNNAGIEGSPIMTADVSEEEWDHMITINLKGVWLCMKHEIPQMLKQGSGAIVNNSSLGGLVGAPGLAVYTASKHAVLGLTKTAALEYARVGIRVNAVCPGPVRTPMCERLMASIPDAKEKLETAHPMGRMAEPEEIAEAVVWLCSDASSYITGHPMVLDGGIVAA